MTVADQRAAREPPVFLHVAYRQYQRRVNLTQGNEILVLVSGVWVGDVYGTLLLLVVLVAGGMVLHGFALDHHALVAGDGLRSLGL